MSDLGLTGIASLRADSERTAFYVPRYRVVVDGAELHARGGDFLSVQFKDSVKELSGFELTLNNWDDGGDGGRPRFKYSEQGSPLDLGKRVDLYLGYVDAPGMELMMVGEITALDPQFPASGAPTLTVRGLDRLHRLRNRPKSRHWTDVTDADVVRTIANENQLDVGTIDDTSPRYENLPQTNQDPLQFLQERAKRLNFELFVQNNALNFRRPREREDAALKLVWGSTLASFTPSLTMARQVSKVTVRGWHPSEGRLISKTVDRARLNEITARGRNAGQILEEQFGEGKEEIITSYGITSDEEAEQLAASVLLDRSYSFITGSGQTFGITRLRAGVTLDLSQLGTRFDGRYYVTDTTHKLDGSGYQTTFNVRKVYA